MYKGIIFDKDGTLILVDQLWSKVYEEAANKLTYQFKMKLDIKKAMLSIGIQDGKIQKGSLAAIGSVKEVLNTILMSGTIDSNGYSINQYINFFETAVTETVKEYKQFVHFIDKDIPIILGELRNNKVMLGLITTDSRENTVFMLEHLGIKDYFHYIGCGDDEHCQSKPAVDHGTCFIRSANLKPESVLMVGDSIYDEVFAEKLGFHFLKIKNRDDFYHLHTL